MNVTVYPSVIHGAIAAAASKSSMQRALAAALLRKGRTVIHNPGSSNDDMAALETIQKLGAVITRSNGSLTVDSKGVNPVSDVLNCGESGLGIRMFTPIAALSSQQLTITGTGSLKSRPMDFFDEIFPQLGIRIQSAGGRLPMVIKGPMHPASIEVNGSLSSQFLTGLLMAYAAAGAKDVEIRVLDLKSKPYIDLTLKVLSDFGWEVENKKYESFHFKESSVAEWPDREYTVEGDWSGAAFLLVAGAIAGEIEVTGLDVVSTQADKAVLNALHSAEASLSLEQNKIKIGRGRLKAFHFDANECPDLFPPLVALASFCDGKSVIEGVNRLTHKESNRALTLQEEFGKLGVKITLQDDLMVIEGVSSVKSAKVHSHHDHRIAMACAVAGLRADGPVMIEDAEAINKSYPDFYEHLRQLEARIE